MNTERIWGVTLDTSIETAELIGQQLQQTAEHEVERQIISAGGQMLNAPQSRIEPALFTDEAGITHEIRKIIAWATYSPVDRGIKS